MDKIVRQHYPVERPPLDLQGAIGPARTVTVTIETEKAASSSASAREVLAEMMRARDRLRADPDPAERISVLRDEWDR